MYVPQKYKAVVEVQTTTLRCRRSPELVHTLFPYASHGRPRFLHYLKFWYIRLMIELT